MSKAQKAKILRGRANQTTLEPRKKASSGSEGAGGGEQLAAECWDFRLIDTTVGSARAVSGTVVSGAIRGGRVAVSASFGLLGFAPADKGRSIIQAASTRGGTLNGTIRSSGDALTRPSARLCLG